MLFLTSCKEYDIMRYMKVDYEKWRIKGLTYYKLGEDYVADGDKCIVSEIWRMRNVKGEEFRLLIRNGKTKSFSLYDSKDNLRLRTTSISKIK